MVAVRGGGQYMLLYQCDRQKADGVCETGHAYIDILSRVRTPLSTDTKNDFAQIAYKYLCHQRSEFTLTSHKGRYLINPGIF